MKNTIKIDGKEYPIKFGYGAIKILGTYLETNGFDSTVLTVTDILQRLTDSEAQKVGIPFEVTDTLGYLVLCGLENADSNFDLDHAEICDFVLMNADILPDIFELFRLAMPQPKAQKKSPRKKTTPQKK
jgi:hypothetical protein